MFPVVRSLPMAIRRGAFFLAAPAALLAQREASLDAVLALRAKPAWEQVANVHVSAVRGPDPRPAPPESAETNADADYWTWAAQVFSPDELADPEASDPDAVYGADGIPNLIKFALGLDPHVDGTAALPETTRLDEHWFYVYRRPGDTAGVAYRIEASTDLINWSDADVTQEPILADDEAVTWQAHYHAVAGETVWFRLVVTGR